MDTTVGQGRSDAEAIASFLDGWRSRVAVSRSGPALRLKRFLKDVHRLRTAAELEPVRPLRTLSPAAAVSLFEGLKAPLASARSTGAFIDIWAVAGLKRKELPNAAVLAWLIDPRGSHGLGPLCLSALLQAAGLAGGPSDASLRLDAARVQAEVRPLGSDRDRVDIVVDLPELLLFIEVKIDAGEGAAQLSRYAESALRVARADADLSGAAPRSTRTLFLSPRPPVETVQGVSHMTWRDLASEFDRASLKAAGLAQTLIRSFSAHVRAFG